VGIKGVVDDRHMHWKPKAAREEDGSRLPRRNQRMCSYADVAGFPAGTGVMQEIAFGGSYMSLVAG
jgi:hypothetical protein